MRRVVANACGLCLLALTSSLSGQGIYQHDWPGTTTIAVHPPGASQHGLSAAEAAAVGKNLTRLRDALAAQAVLRVPAGVAVTGDLRADGQQAGPARGPVQSQGTLWYYPALSKPRSGGSHVAYEATFSVIVYVNLSTGGLTRQEGTFYLEPERRGEVGGIPIYRLEHDAELLCLSRTGAPPWALVTREEFLLAATANWKKQADETPQAPMMRQFVERHEAALAAMSPEQRKMQARYLPPRTSPFEPYLAPIGSREGRALVKAGYTWADPAAPRSAIQLVMLKFDYSSELNPDRPAPTSTGSIADVRVWETLHKSDWKAVLAVIGGAPAR